ncbi:spore germination protein [Sutcliffiella horikoshii]|uniref:spore germination protein n=1 Tax=Sutcliffiella horikoshii TaxID=79883 RepID=UPI00384D10CE
MKHASSSLETLDTNLIEHNLLNEELKVYFKNYADVYFISLEEKYRNLSAFYCVGMVDISQVNKYFHSIIQYVQDGEEAVAENELPPMEKVNSMSGLIDKVFSGYFIVYLHPSNYFLAFELADVPKREPSESNTEISIKGPKDGFTEELFINIALIRKRLKSPYLFNENFEIGKLSKTAVSLLYLDDRVNKEMLSEVRSRLEQMETESLVSSGQLEQWLSNRTFSLFPLFDYIGRPDFAVECILRGRFIVIVDGSPMILIGPNNVFVLLKSPEDIHFPYHTVAFQRIFRIIGFFIAVMLPGFWIAISAVNVDQLPFQLLNTVSLSREGLPIPLGLEAFFILGLFELLREAGIRMPKAVGQTVAIVGGLIIGDAAIRAGLASATMIVVVALTAVATFTLVNQSLTGTVSVLRIYIMLLGVFLGIYGVFIGLFSILFYLARLESFKVGYLEPISTLSFKDILSALLVNPFKNRQFDAPMLQQKESQKE